MCSIVDCVRIGNLRTTTTTSSTTTGGDIPCTAQARLANFVVVSRRGVVDDAKHSRITSSCSPKALAGIPPCF